MYCVQYIAKISLIIVTINRTLKEFKILIIRFIGP